MSTTEWVLGTAVALVSVLAWWQTGGGAGGYNIFPLLGLIAFGLMWTHFISGAVKRYFNLKASSSSYASVTMGIVLVLILLHPGILWYELFRNGLGLPPLSVYAAYPAQMLAVSLGSVGLAIFLAYEAKRFFGSKSWWKYIEWLQVVGMIAIFVHALNLGGALSLPWFRVLWYFYGITLLIATIYSWMMNQNKGVANG